MPSNQLCWMVGGPQGSGVDSAARLFALATSRGGLHVVGQREYYSNIKGEHSYYKIRVDERLIRGPINPVHLLATYENETVCRHLFSDAMVEGGAIIYDPSLVEDTVDSITFLDHRVKHAIAESFGKPEDEVTVQMVLERAEEKGVRLFAFPYDELLEKIAEELGQDDTSRLQILKNTMATAASLGILDFDLGVLNKTFELIFGDKKQKIIDMNVVAARVSAQYMKDTFGDFGWTLSPVEPDEERVFIQGTEAVGLGKMVAGCRMQTYYPISPATDESVFLEGHPASGVAVVQVEDEISAVTMAIGAALTGARSSTSTSGPGFNLMVEGMGWAGICEVPLVVLNYQRGGPSTGLPTRTEQGDLRFALHAGHSEYPRLLLVPGDVQEMFYDTIDAFNWAERYQTPVILMPDKQLAGNSGTTVPFDTSGVKIERGNLATEEELDGGDEGIHQRFAFAENGLSLRSVLGQEGGIHWLTGDEHTEVGHITEDPVVRDRMMEKRDAKLKLAAEEIPSERKAVLHGPEDAEVTVVSWGSTKGSILDALDELNADGDKVNFLQVRILSPFPEQEIADVLGRAGRTVCIEENYSGQLAGLIRERTGIKLDHIAVKYNGRPTTVDEVVSTVEEVLAKGPERIVLRQGV